MFFTRCVRKLWNQQFGKTTALKLFSLIKLSSQECHLDSSVQFSRANISSYAFWFQGGCGGFASFFFWREVDGSPFSRYRCPCQGLCGFPACDSVVDLISDLLHHLHFILQWWHLNFSVAFVFRVIHAHIALFLAAISRQCSTLWICCSILVSIQFQGFCRCVFTTRRLVAVALGHFGNFCG